MKILFEKLKWLFLFVFALSTFLTFTSCHDDIVGPQINEKEDEDQKEDGTGEDPNDSGGIATIFISFPETDACYS
mgnify:CR=1 FL=1